jgi:tyrosinase
MMVTRKAAWRDDIPVNGWSDDWIWYAAAIARMKAATSDLDQFRNAFVQALLNPLADGSLDPARVAPMVEVLQTWTDPLSLGYQSQVHGTFAGDRSTWPNFQGETVLWKECAHDQWFFLPWHRAFLIEFERVVRQHIDALQGPSADWALPYWNYTDFQADATRLGLPLPLRGANLPPGVVIPGLQEVAGQPTPNPLFEPTRQATGDMAAGESSSWASARIALRRPHFANQQDTTGVSLGGGVIEDANNAALFHRGGERGQLDSQPHGMTHNHVGGFMWLFETAALDPVFWVHHCNVDRLWETYANDLGRGYPFSQGATPASAAKTSWNTHEFKFLRPDGTVKPWTAVQMTDIETLGYEYADTTPPPLPAVAPGPPGSEIDPFGIAPDAVPEPLASATDVELAGLTRAILDGPPPEAGQPPLVAASFPPDTQWRLRLTGVRATGPARTSFDVFVGLGPGVAADSDDSEHYCGGLSMFGAYEATVDDGVSPANGLTQLIDVTEQVHAQRQRFAIDGAAVTFVPVHPDRDLSGMSIDQITLEFS